MVQAAITVRWPLKAKKKHPYVQRRRRRERGEKGHVNNGRHVNATRGSTLLLLTDWSH